MFPLEKEALLYTMGKKFFPLSAAVKLKIVFNVVINLGIDAPWRILHVKFGQPK